MKEKLEKAHAMAAGAIGLLSLMIARRSANKALVVIICTRLRKAADLIEEAFK